MNHEHIESDSRTVFGFFTYLMTDIVLFAALFATYAVLRANTFGGPGSDELFDLPFALLETLLLLFSSLAAAVSLLAARKGSIVGVIISLSATFALGGAFLLLELSEFAKLVAMGAGPSRSAFLSSYFTLVGTHGLHIFIGLVWVAALMAAVAVRGLTRSTMRRLALFTLFWHFLDIIWIFIFTIVYLFGTVL